MSGKMIFQGNILEPEQFRSTPIGVMSRISEIIGSTLGPAGSNVCIYDTMEGNHRVTKDGYHILRSISFPDSVAQMVLDTIRGVVRRVIVNVGDGSTSTVVLSSHLMENLSEVYETHVIKDKNISPSVFRSIQDSIVRVIVDYIRKRSVSVLKDNLDGLQVIDTGKMARITSHAANNDDEIGEMIAETLHLPTDRIAIEVGGPLQETTRIDSSSGYRFPRGYSHEGFIRKDNFDNGRYFVTIEEGEPNNPSGINVLIASGRKVDEQFFMNVIMPVLAMNVNLNQPCLIVVPEMPPTFRTHLMELAAKDDRHNILLLDYRHDNERDIRWVGDLALYCGAKIVPIEGVYPKIKDHQKIKKEEIERIKDILGSVDALHSTSTETIMRKKDVDPRAIQERIAKINLEMQNASESASGDEMQDIILHKRNRIQSLSGSQSKIIVGGATRQEKQHAADLLEDATLAAYSAIEHGIVPGAGFNVASILVEEEITDKVVLEIGDDRYRDIVAEIKNEYLASYLDYITTLLGNGSIREITREDAMSLVVDGYIHDMVMGSKVPARDLTVAYPAATDIEILRGVSSIVGLYLSSDYVVVPA